MHSFQNQKHMCDYCERSYSDAEYDDRQTVCECGHLIISKSHVLPKQIVRRRLGQKSTPGIEWATTVSVWSVPAFHCADVASAKIAFPSVRCTGKTKPTAVFSPAAKKSAEFAFGKVIKSQGSKSEPVALGKLSAPHVGRFAPITPLALPTDLGQRCRRKSKSMGAYPERPLLLSSSECIGNLSIEAEDTQAWQNSPKRRSINQTDQNEKEAGIKKPRCSLPRSFCAGGAWVSRGLHCTG